MEYVEGEAALKNFESAMGDLLSVSHSEIKAKLDAEKQAKVDKPRKRRNIQLDKSKQKPKI